MYRFIVLMAFLLHCGYEFPTSYESVDGNKVRPIAVIFDNNGMPEGAPRDTMTVKTYFGGEPVKAITWSYLYNSNSSDTIQLQKIIVPGTYEEYTGTNTDSIIFRLVIPDSFIRNEFTKIQSFGALVPEYISSTFSTALIQRKPGDVLDFLDLLSSGPSRAQNADSLFRFLAGDSNADFKTVLPYILQIFSVYLKIHAVINGKYEMESSLTVRYNAKLRYLGSYIPVNMNQKIEKMYLYRVKGDKESFESGKDIIDAIYDLAMVDSIPYEKGCSYFLEVVRKDPQDSAFSMSGFRDLENHTCEWFMQDNNKLNASDRNCFKIKYEMSRTSLVKINMPSNPVNRTFLVWCVMYDYFIGERLRPVGFSMQCFKETFVDAK
ncbi:MAG TPA: hypothetical protein VHP36_10310 [Chitinispirillaceae bacterium]|nr:hypothetical protein [Chitinispirillaceae bacterium]